MSNINANLSLSFVSPPGLRGVEPDDVLFAIPWAEEGNVGVWGVWMLFEGGGC